MYTNLPFIKKRQCAGVCLSLQFISKSRETLLTARNNTRTDQQSINILELDASCRWSGPLMVSSPCEQSHYDHHDRQSHTDHNAADGEVDWTINDRWRNQILGKGRVFEQKGRREVQKDHPGVFFGVYLTPPLLVVVLPLEVCHQSDVAASVANQFIPAQDHQRNITQLSFITS